MINDVEQKKRCRVFLGGPFKHAIGADCIYEASLRKQIEEIYEILSKEFKVYSAHYAEEFGNLTTQLTSEKIVARDHHWMLKCDVFVAVIPADEYGTTLRSDGTCIEIGWASTMRKPIILLTNLIPLTAHYSHLIRGLNAVANIYICNLKAAIKNPGVLLERLKDIIAAGPDGAIREVMDEGKGPPLLNCEVK